MFLEKLISKYGLSPIEAEELIADFIGIYSAFGFYKAEWFLRFMGVTEGGGNRLDFYTGGLSPKVRQAVRELTKQAAFGLEEWSLSEEFKSLTACERITHMCHIGINGMVEQIKGGYKYENNDDKE